MTGWTHARSTGRTIGFALTLGLGLAALMAGDAFAKAPQTEDEKTLYFIGIVISGQPPLGPPSLPNPMMDDPQSTAGSPVISDISAATA